MKEIIGYEGLYFITHSGEVVSTKTGKMSTYTLNSGYQAVKLVKNGVRKSFTIHRLVARHFCEGYAEDKVVDHIDGNRYNNHYLNLRWVNQKENVANQISRGTLNVDTAQKVAWEKNKKPVKATTVDGTWNKIYLSIKEACEDLKVDSSKVTEVAKGRRKTHKGYTFEYL